MIENYIFIAFLGIFCGMCIWWGTKTLPEENWQFLASIPVKKHEDGSWEAVNITWYGFLVAGSNAFAALIFFIMLGAARIPFVAGLVLLTALLIICVPAASLVARIVEKKPATLTVGGAVFVGSLIVPFLIILFNRVIGKPMGFFLPIPQTLAACAVSFLFGEGLGRLACLSYGCCYGKPVENYTGILRRLFEKTAIVFQGKNKKIAYASGLDGHRIIPIQPITMVAYVAAGMLSLLLSAEGNYLSSYLIASVFASFWRVSSEVFREDFRGGGRISAYQVMSGISALYAMVVAYVVRDGNISIQANLVQGMVSLWSPGPIIALFTLWCLMFAFAGISTTTFSRVRFYLHENRE
jgi:hypothetical protein